MAGTIQFLVGKETAEKIREKSRQTGLSTGEIVRSVIVAYLVAPHKFRFVETEEEKTEKIKISVPDRVYELVKTEAERKGFSISFLIRGVLNYFFEVE